MAPVGRKALPFPAAGEETSVVRVAGAAVFVPDNIHADMLAPSVKIRKPVMSFLTSSIV
jgi:hypothetical protein